MDGDGRLDLLTGSDNCCDREPGFYWFRRTADGHSKARRKVRVKVRGSEEMIMARFRAALSDWDGDGRLEVVAAARRDQAGSVHKRWVVVAERRGHREPTGVREPRRSPPPTVHHRLGRRRPARPDLLVLPVRGRLDRGLDDWSEPWLAGPQSLLNLPEREIAVGLSTGDWDGDGWSDLIVGYLRGESDRETLDCVHDGGRQDLPAPEVLDRDCLDRQVMVARVRGNAVKHSGMPGARGAEERASERVKSGTDSGSISS